MMTKEPGLSALCRYTRVSFNENNMQVTHPEEKFEQEHTAKNTRSLYFDLFDGRVSSARAVGFLKDRLNQVENVESDLPDDMNNLGLWMHANMEKVGRSYRQYLINRKAGEARRYFHNKSHALYFLQSVAPTKMVDGAWLYGLLERWQDGRFSSLIQTYLEELGEGSPSQNHVALYKRLLAAHGCERWKDLSDKYYVQGAIQLSLAYHADEFLPEIIGFNLGYEQLPLHLLITAYELKELGIDPYYFSLHITVDNGDSGHAKKAVDAVIDAMPKLGDAKEFYRRVCNGYKLSFLGENTCSVSESFDIDREMVAIFSRKGVVGQYAHSDYRQIAGRSITSWLSDPDQSADLLSAMEKEGWFKRHQDPQNSRFWKLICGDKARMAGVFNDYEQQIIYDWIAGDAAGSIPFDYKKNSPAQLTFEKKQQIRELTGNSSSDGLVISMPKASGTRPANEVAEESANDFDVELRMFQANLASLTNQEDKMKMLVSMMSPANHHTESGLMAIRIFSDIFR